jgi:hypothetical protein
MSEPVSMATRDLSLTWSKRDTVNRNSIFYSHLQVYDSGKEIEFSEFCKWISRQLDIETLLMCISNHCGTEKSS